MQDQGVRRSAHHRAPVLHVIGETTLAAGRSAGSLHPALKRVGQEQGGFNIFRRFRLTHLEKMDCREALKHFWAGHAPAHVSERYIKLVGEREYRLKEAERIGTGFQVPKVPQPGQLIVIPRVA